LIESKDPNANQLEAADFTELFLPVLAAAIDTICATLTFALWDLARFPDFRKRAAEEVAKFFPSRDDMTALALDDLPFLNAFLWESMRYHGVPVSLNERVAPDGGALVSGVFLPAGVVLSVSFADIGDCYMRSPMSINGSKIISVS
jgi:cytochrome P450